MVQLKKISVRSVSEFLTEPEMKRVTGGYGSGTCAAISETGTCLFGCATNSKTEAIFWAGCKDKTNGTNCSGNWCCDSCSSASWYSGCNC